MSTRGETVRTVRSGVSRRVPGAVGVINVAMLDLLLVDPLLMPTFLVRSAVDRDFLRRQLGRAGEPHPEDAVGVLRLRAVGVEPLAEADGPRERAELSLAPVILLVGDPGFGLALTTQRHGVADDADFERGTVHAGAE